MKTVKQLLKEAIELDEALLAHLIYFALEKGKVEETDDIKKLDTLQFSQQEAKAFRRMYKQDVLGMRRIMLYAVKSAVSPLRYAFYFAETPEQVVKLHESIFKWRPRKIHNVHGQWLYQDIYDMEAKKVESFKQMLDQAIEFPCYLCEVRLSG